MRSLYKAHPRRLLTLLALLIANPLTISVAAGKKPAGTPASDASAAAAGSDKLTAGVLDELKLKDPAAAGKVAAASDRHFAALRAWHEAHDAEVKALRQEFDKARSAHDQVAADAATAKIDQVYSGLDPEQKQYREELSSVLTLAQMVAVDDRLTIHTVNRTYNAYQLIFPGLTPAQNTFIMGELVAAREDAVKGPSKQEVAAFFKKHKIRIEAYLTQQGFDVKKGYEVFVAKQKADMKKKTDGKDNSDPLP